MENLQGVGAGISTEGEGNAPQGGGKLFVGGPGHNQQAVYVGHVGDGHRTQLNPGNLPGVVFISGILNVRLREADVVQGYVGDAALPVNAHYDWHCGVAAAPHYREKDVPREGVDRHVPNLNVFPGAAHVRCQRSVQVFQVQGFRLADHGRISHVQGKNGGANIVPHEKDTFRAKGQRPN